MLRHRTSRTTRAVSTHAHAPHASAQNDTHRVERTRAMSPMRPQLMRPHQTTRSLSYDDRRCRPASAARSGRRARRRTLAVVRRPLCRSESDQRGRSHARGAAGSATAPRVAPPRPQPPEQVAPRPAERRDELDALEPGASPRGTPRRRATRRRRPRQRTPGRSRRPGRAPRAASAHRPPAGARRTRWPRRSISFATHAPSPVPYPSACDRSAARSARCRCHTKADGSTASAPPESSTRVNRSGSSPARDGVPGPSATSKPPRAMAAARRSDMFAPVPNAPTENGKSGRSAGGAAVRNTRRSRFRAQVTRSSKYRCVGVRSSPLGTSPVTQTTSASRA